MADILNAIMQAGLVMEKTVECNASEAGLRVDGLSDLPHDFYVMGPETRVVRRVSQDSYREIDNSCGVAARLSRSILRDHSGYVDRSCGNRTRRSSLTYASRTDGIPATRSDLGAASALTRTSRHTPSTPAPVANCQGPFSENGSSLLMWA